MMVFGELNRICLLIYWILFSALSLRAAGENLSISHEVGGRQCYYEEDPINFEIITKGVSRFHCVAIRRCFAPGNPDPKYGYSAIESDRKDKCPIMKSYLEHPSRFVTGFSQEPKSGIVGATESREKADAGFVRARAIFYIGERYFSEKFGWCRYIDAVPAPLLVSFHVGPSKDTKVEWNYCVALANCERGGRRNAKCERLPDGNCQRLNDCLDNPLPNVTDQPVNEADIGPIAENVKWIEEQKKRQAAAQEFQNSTVAPTGTLASTRVARTPIAHVIPPPPPPARGVSGP